MIVWLSVELFSMLIPEINFVMQLHNTRLYKRSSALRGTRGVPQIDGSDRREYGKGGLDEPVSLNSLLGRNFLEAPSRSVRFGNEGGSS